MESATMTSSTLVSSVAAAEAAFHGISKVVRYGFETGPIWPPKWSDIVSWTAISDHFRSHIVPLWKLVFGRNSYCLGHIYPIKSDFHNNYVITCGEATQDKGPCLSSSPPGIKVIFWLIKIPWNFNWFQIWGQIWPLRLFGGCGGLGGCQKGPYDISNMHMDK